MSLRGYSPRFACFSVTDGIFASVWPGEEKQRGDGGGEQRAFGSVNEGRSPCEL